MAKISLKVNGRPRVVDTDPDVPLLYVLRNDLGLNGPRFGCGFGQCGACTVMMEGKAVRSCTMPVARRTIERHHLEGLGSLSILTRCRKRSSKSRPRNAGTA